MDVLDHPVVVGFPLGGEWTVERTPADQDLTRGLIPIHGRMCRRRLARSNAGSAGRNVLEYELAA
jgi:hypothetical protein